MSISHTGTSPGDCSRGGDAATARLLPARGAGVRDLCAPPQPRVICDGLQRRQASSLRHEAGQRQSLSFPATLCLYVLTGPTWLNY